MSVAPPFTYFGAKQRIADRITAMLPAHTHYVEPFCGSLSVLLAKPPSPHETVNDLDGKLMTFWRVLREQPAELVRACALTPHCRAEFESILDGDPSGVTDLEMARRVWVRLTQGRGATTAQRTGWRYYVDPAGTNSSMPDYLDGYITRMPAVLRRLRHVSLESRPALEVIARYGRFPANLLYCDPPYLGDTRANTRYRYAHEMQDETSHVTLLGALLACESAVAVSGYPSALYDSALTGWDRVEIRASKGNGADRSAVEVLWSNRPLNRPRTLWELHDDAS